MKFETYWDFMSWADETRKRPDLTEDEAEQMILDSYNKNGGICGMSLLGGINNCVDARCDDAD